MLSEKSFRDKFLKSLSSMKSSKITLTQYPNLGGGEKGKFTPSRFSLYKSETRKAVTLEFCSIQ